MWKPFIPPGRVPLRPLDSGAAAPAAAGKEPEKAAAAAAPRAAAGAAGPQAAPLAEDERIFSVGYCKKNDAKKRKNKVFLDGVVVVRGNTVVLFNSEGKQVTSQKVKGDLSRLADGSELTAGNWDLEFANAVAPAAYYSGTAFLTASAPAPPPVAAWVPPAAAAPAFKPVGGAGGGAAVPRPPPPPLHDPGAPNALVLCTAADPRLLALKAVSRTAVVVDPYLSRRLRPHQREGVAFLWEAVSGLRGDPAGGGALLCDEMGLGKTLQLLTLIWTLLKQSPAGGPACRRAVVVCPASLVDNWGAEVGKWLGSERLGCTLIRGGGEAAKQAAAEWANPSQTARPMLITSYETLRLIAAQVSQAKPGILVCDEAHRLKTESSKTLEALRSLGAARRVLLSGTPVQNNLSELYHLVSFAAPSLLGEASSFRRIFEAPIAAGLERGASREAKRLGEERNAQLMRLVAGVMLRRDASVNQAYLPPRQDFVVFVRPTPLQDALYTAFLKQPQMRSVAMGGGTGSLPPLAAIILLRRLCNSPDAFFASADAAAEEGAEAAAALQSNDSQRVVAQLEGLRAGFAGGQSSAKLAVLASMLTSLPADERCVVVAGWTQTLDLVANLCAQLDLQTARLDGSTPPDARVALVRRFNAGGAGRVFLLSTQAGGVGLNLVGASRLVLFDTSWNPAHDLQAMGRIWRDGQTKPVFLYRLLTAGTLEERMFQRSVVKGETAKAVGAGAGGGGKSGGKGGNGSSSFTKDELRALFTYTPGCVCNTAELLRQGGGEAAAQWQDCSASLTDGVLAAAVAAGGVSFVYAGAGGMEAAEAEAEEEAEEAAGDSSSSDDDGWGAKRARSGPDEDDEVDGDGAAAADGQQPATTTFRRLRKAGDW